MQMMGAQKSRCPSPVSEDSHSMGSGFPLCLKTYRWFWYDSQTQCKASALQEIIPDYFVIL